ncbi:MAG: AMP-binding protein, partial [Microcystaceae cyanobacterium]
MTVNIELKRDSEKNRSELARSNFFWKDPKLFDEYRDQNINTLIAIYQVLSRQSFQDTEEDVNEIKEFLEIYDKIALDPTNFFTSIWSDPSASHWCQLAFDLVKATLTGKPLPLVTQQYCKAIGKKTPLQGLIAHLNQFKQFAIAQAYLYDNDYQFEIPFIPRLPLAIPGTPLYLEGTAEIKIIGIKQQTLDILVNNQQQSLKLIPNATIADQSLTVGECPTLPLNHWKLRFQPYCYNSPAFPDAETIIEAGMNYQVQYVPLVKEGLSLIEQHHPRTFEQLHYFMQVLTLKSPETGTFTNLSSSDFPGASVWSVFNNPYRLADNFIHEFHHNRLFLIEKNNPLLLDSVEDAQANNLYYSPWRYDLRPLRGIFHAIYVYTPVAQFWLNVYRKQPIGELLNFAKSQLIEISLQLQIGLEQLRKYANFTPLGQDLLDELSSNGAEIAQAITDLQIPLDTPALDYHRNGSFQYQLEGKTARCLTVKEVIAKHIHCLDYYKQVKPQFQTDLGLEPFSEENGEGRKPAIAYGEPITGKLEILPTLVDTLKRWIDQASQGCLIDLTEKQGISRSYGDIWQQATLLLSYLQAQELSTGDFVIIQVEGCHDFIAAIWSCFLGGFVPVPISVSANRSQTPSQASKLHQVWQTLDHPVILSQTGLIDTIKATIKDETAQILTLETGQNFAPSETFNVNHPEDLALILTSSGTTGAPKLISFDAITLISQFLGDNQQDNSSSLTWIPFDNASGFSIIKPKLGQTFYLPAERFLGNPLLWLEMIDQYKVQRTVLTNFAMTQIIKQIQEKGQKEGNLSSIESIGLGSEKINPQTCRTFLETLQPLGMGSDVLSIAYGLSETGVVASTRQWMAMGYSQRSEQFMQIGKPSVGCGIRIVNDEHNLLNEGEIGNIQLWGASMTRGYYNNSALNRTLFTEDGWFNTGDLGFITDGCLTVTGRKKEIIIINGKNYSCQEIESIVEEVEGVQPAYTVAVSLRQPESETEELAILFNSHLTEEKQLGNLAKQIRGKLTQILGINPTYLIPLEQGAIPRTVTGKIKRLNLKQRLETGEFEPIIKWVDALIQQALEQTYLAPRNEVESQLVKIWQAVLNVHKIGIYDNFFNLGGNSLIAANLVAEIDQLYPQKLSVAALYQAPTVEKLAKILSEEEWSSDWYSLVPIQPLGDQIPLFAIHLLGEGLNFYRPLANYLGLRQPIYGLNYGLAARKGEDKEVKLPPIEELAAHYIEEMRTFYPQGPYILLGVSNGGNVAFEMAKQLQAQGQTVAKLILLDT